MSIGGMECGKNVRARRIAGPGLQEGTGSNAGSVGRVAVVTNVSVDGVVGQLAKWGDRRFGRVCTVVAIHIVLLGRERIQGLGGRWVGGCEMFVRTKAKAGPSGKGTSRGGSELDEG